MCEEGESWMCEKCGAELGRLNDNGLSLLDNSGKLMQLPAEIHKIKVACKACGTRRSFSRAAWLWIRHQEARSAWARGSGFATKAENSD